MVKPLRAGSARVVVKRASPARVSARQSERVDPRRRGGDRHRPLVAGGVPVDLVVVVEVEHGEPGAVGDAVVPAAGDRAVGVADADAAVGPVARNAEGLGPTPLVLHPQHLEHDAVVEAAAPLVAHGHVAVDAVAPRALEVVEDVLGDVQGRVALDLDRHVHAHDVLGLGPPRDEQRRERDEQRRECNDPRRERRHERGHLPARPRREAPHACGWKLTAGAARSASSSSSK
jgi:hypothetical protein